MTAILFISGFVYSLITLVAWRLLTYHLAYRFARSSRTFLYCHNCDKGSYGSSDELQRHSPDGAQIFGGLVIGLLLAVVWPLTAVFLAPLPRVGDHAQAFADAQARRIATLEREAGLDA